MPNHITNIVAVSGDESRVKSILKEFRLTNTAWVRWISIR